MRNVAACLAVLVLVSCGGGSDSPDSSTTPASPTSPTSPAPQSWVLAGQVTDSVTGAPVPGAAITIDVRPSLTTDSAGRFRLEGTGAMQPTLAASIVAGGYLPRETFLTWNSAGRTDIALEVIPERAPFVLSFYRALVRNGLEEPTSLQALRRWSRNPNFYVQTLNPKTGRALEPQELDLLIGTLREAVPQLTGGALTAGLVETGQAARERRKGYINVKIVYEPSEDYCGQAYVGANPGEIEINYDRCASTCGSLKVTPTAIAHEVGHALGFWHVERGIMTAVVSSNCSNVQFSEAERTHARLAYRRPAGNSDPDRDPTTFAAAATAAAPRIACALAPR